MAGVLWLAQAVSRNGAKTAAHRLWTERKLLGSVMTLRNPVIAEIVADFHRRRQSTYSAIPPRGRPAAWREPLGPARVSSPSATDRATILPDAQCIRYPVRPDHRDRLLNWFSNLEGRSDDLLEVMADSGILAEAVFLETTEIARP